MDLIVGQARRDCAQREIDDLGGLGFEPEEVDLRDYFGKSGELETRLAARGLIWVRGGNTFILRRAMRESGFDAWLSKNAGKDSLVYGGYSAGVCLLGATLRGLELVDPPDEVPAGYSSDVIWDGLGLIDYSIAPHYQSDHPESGAMNEVVRYFKDHDMKYRTMRDGDVIIIQ